MVKQYLREENNHRMCYSCESNSINDDNLGTLCRKCQIKNDSIKKKIIETMAQCEDLLGNEKMIPFEKIYEEINHLYEIIDQRTKAVIDKIDKYQEELENLLAEQQKANEINA